MPFIESGKTREFFCCTNDSHTWNGLIAIDQSRNVIFTILIDVALQLVCLPQEKEISTTTFE